MASGQVAAIAPPPRADLAGTSVSHKNVSDALTEQERFELEQCQKIIKFRDEVLAGKHPKVKLPAHLASKLAASANKSSPPNLLPASQVYKNLNKPARQANQQQPAPANAPTSPHASAAPDGPAARTPSSMTFATGRTEINPVLLEKSDHLIRAELGLQRQKLERALRDDGDQKKGVAQIEAPEELDVSDILAKAQSLVQATTSPTSTGAVETANATAEKESSFDENDYYSSNHETLDSHDSPGSVDRTRQSDVGNRDAPSGLAHVVPMGQDATQQPGSRSAHPSTDNRAGNQPPPQPQPLLHPQPTYPVLHVPGLPSRPPSVGTNDNPPDDTTTHSGSGAQRSTNLQSVRNSLASADATRSDTSARMEVAQGELDTYSGRWMPREPGYAAPEQRGPPGLSLSQNATAIPPAAESTSPLMTGARQVAPPAVNWNAPPGAPAQVAALRGGQQAPSSPESSSPHGKASERKKKKKNKRKADRLAQDTGAAYIKPEPRSPSPLSAPAQIRPAKRQKQAQRADDGVTYEHPQPHGPIRPDFYQLSGPQPGEERPQPVTYRRYAAGAPDASPAFGGQGYERVYHDEAHPSMQPLPRGHYAPQAASPRGYPVPYAGEEYVPTRSVSYREPARYYQDEYARPPEPESAMAGPQRPPLTRVMVDAFGREYYEPAYHQPLRQSAAPSARPADPDVLYEGAAPIRHSVAPSMRPREADIMYERSAPVRGLSRRPLGGETYEEGGIIYRRASPPAYAPQRRVVTQPEYGAPEPMGYPRSYSVRPMAPPGDEYAAATERRPVEGAPRPYSMRAASARPLEPVRYDMTAEGSGGHMQSRPEPPADFGIPRPQSQVDVMGPPVARDFAPRPVGTPGMPRAYSTRPVERYYQEPQAMGEEVAYVGRPPQPGVAYHPRGDVYQ